MTLYLVVIHADKLRKVCDYYDFEDADKQNLIEHTRPFVVGAIHPEADLHALLVNRPSSMHIGLPKHWRLAAVGIWKDATCVKYDSDYFDTSTILSGMIEERAQWLRQHLPVYTGRIGLKMLLEMPVPEMRHAQIYYNADTEKHWLVIGDAVAFFQVRTTHLDQARLGKQAATSFVEGKCDYIECENEQDAALKLAKHYSKELERLA